MKFTTDAQEEYDVDLSAKTAVRTVAGVKVNLVFDRVIGIYTGSTVGKFKRDGVDINIYGEIISVAGSPNEFAVGEQGNVVFRTKNSTYEINQEEKLFRRLAGINPPTDWSEPDGDWKPYNLIYLNLNSPCFIDHTVEGESMTITTSRVREIEGTFVEPPPVLAVSMELVDAAHPPL